MTSLGLLDDALHAFDGAIASAYPELMTLAKMLWGALFVLQLGYIVFHATKTGDFDTMIWHMICGLLGAGVSYAILTHSLEWGTDIVAGGQEIAAMAGGVSPTAATPSGIVDQGFKIVTIIWDHISLGTWLIHTSDAVALYIAGFITGAAFFAAGLVYFFTLLIATFLVAWGCMPLGFSALEWTWPITVRWAQQVLARALRLAVILLIIGAGMGMIGRWTTTLEAGLNSGRGVIWNEWGLMIGFVSFLWFAVILTLPREISALVAATTGSHGEMWVGMAGRSAVSVAAGVATEGATVIGQGAMQTVRESLTE